jgi:peptide/nickel transport system substrate-binding protein
VSLGWFGLLVNLDNGPKSNNPLGKDARVRRAFELSLDRDAINQVVFNGEFVPGNQWVNPQSPFYQAAFPIPKRDVAKAKALLKEAGVTTPITVDFMVTNGPEPRAVAEVVQSMAAEAGFDLKLRVTEAATAQKQSEDGDFQLYMNNWSGRIDPDGNSVIYQACGAPMNMGHYCDKEVDALHEAARTATTEAARKAAYEKLTAKFLANGWIIYLYHPQYLIASTDRVEGFKPMPDGMLRVVGVKLK